MRLSQYFPHYFQNCLLYLHVIVIVAIYSPSTAGLLDSEAYGDGGGGGGDEGNYDAGGGQGDTGEADPFSGINISSSDSDDLDCPAEGSSTSAAIRGATNRLHFADGYSCLYNSSFNDLVDCYMDYFGFDHEGGFNHACQKRSVVDLAPIFAFLQYFTGCDLINDVGNRKCRDTGGKSVQAPEDGGETNKARITRKVTPSRVRLSYNSNPEDEASATSNLVPQLVFMDQSGGIDDGPRFPRPPRKGPEGPVSMNVTKAGKYNANYTLEINGYGGYRRLMLVLTGKAQMWFRLHCYLCGAWMEVRTNCTHRVVEFSAGIPTVVVPIRRGTNETGDGECSLWKGGETAKTLKLEADYKLKEELDRNNSETTTVTATTQDRGLIFDDIIIPPHKLYSSLNATHKE